MTVCDLKRGERAVVLKIELPAGVRDRLFGLDLRVGSPVCVLKVSLRKKWYVLQSGSSQFALRREAAEGIRVWKT